MKVENQGRSKTDTKNMIINKRDTDTAGGEREDGRECPHVGVIARLIILSQS